MTMKNPVHLGEILREDVLADLGLSVSEAASRLGISRVALSRVLHGHARISSNLAVRLEEAGVGTARAWLAMQSAHDLAAERAAGTPKVQPPNPSPNPRYAHRTDAPAAKWVSVAQEVQPTGETTGRAVAGEGLTCLIERMA